MKTVVVAAMLVVFAGAVSYANYSMLTCDGEKGTVIKVYLNGKLINKRPSETVNVKSNGGCNSISVIVFNSALDQIFSVQRDIDIESGYQVYFKVTSDECGPKLSVTRRYPLLNTSSYSKKLYTRRYVS